MHPLRLLKHVIIACVLVTVLFQIFFAWKNSLNVTTALSQGVAPPPPSSVDKDPTKGRADNEQIMATKQPIIKNNHLIAEDKENHNTKNDTNITKDIAAATKYEHYFRSPLPHPKAKFNLKPSVGKNNRKGDEIKQQREQHRTNVSHAIFACALNPSYQMRDYLRFLGSLAHVGFHGDVVIAVPNSLPGYIEQYLQHYSNRQQQEEASFTIHLIFYKIPLNCIKVKIRTHCTTPNMFHLDGKDLPDSRSPREVAQLRFELYWAWSTLYSNDTLIFLLDFRDVFFQSHPFFQNTLSDTTIAAALSPTTLFAFEEAQNITLGQQRSNRRWMKKGHGEEWFQRFKDLNILCSGTTVGGQIAIERYTRAMIAQWDETECLVYGCDQGHHNYLLRGKFLETTTDPIHVVIFPQGHGLVNTLGLLVQENQTTKVRGLLSPQNHHQVFNWDGTVSPILHQYDRDVHLMPIIEARTEIFRNEWNEIKSSQNK